MQFYIEYTSVIFNIHTDCVNIDDSLMKVIIFNDSAYQTFILHLIVSKIECNLPILIIIH